MKLSLCAFKNSYLFIVHIGEHKDDSSNCVYWTEHYAAARKNVDTLSGRG